MNRKMLELVEKMQNGYPEKKKGIFGFDGYVDTIVHPVEKRLSDDSYLRIETLTDYGQKFKEAAGLSLNIEMVPIKTKIGGNGTILANALADFGMDITYIGAMGRDNLNPAYYDLKNKANLYSISDPGVTDAIEFMDGKIISSKLEMLKAVNWNNLLKVVSQKQLADILDKCDVVGFCGWTLTINVMSIWEGIVREVFPLMTQKRKSNIFFDLADPSKRISVDIMNAIECIQKYGEKFNISIGFNEKEGYTIAELFGRKKSDFSSVLEVAEFLRKRLNVFCVVIHPVKYACAATKTQKAVVDGPYCCKPRLTTGAGDNFNAGFILGLVMGYDLEEALMLGNASSGFYVRNERSANYAELCKFVKEWRDGHIRD